MSLHFTAEPKLEKLPSVKIVDKGDVPELGCRGSGWPMPRVSWWRNGSEILDGDYFHSYIIRYYLGNNLLSMKILDVVGYHQGTHTCRAENLFGTIEENVYIMVKSE